MIKTSACVVLYNPTSEVIENVATYAEKVDHFIVIDNSDIKQTSIIETLKNNHTNLIYIDNQGNLGIATALNTACDTAIIQHSNWILTMDQDSKFINFESYLNCLNSLADLSNTALLAANPGRFNVDQTQKHKSDCTHEEHFLVITSGNFLNLNLFNKIGRFDDNLFIDVVDYDYCAKIKLAGYKTLLFKNIFLEHQLGVLHQRKNLLTRKIRYKREHSPQRAYYIARNYLYLSRKYGKLFPHEFSLLKVLNIIFVHDVTKIFLYEDQKCKKIAAKLLGAYHFMIGKYGKHLLKY